MTKQGVGDRALLSVLFAEAAAQAAQPGAEEAVRTSGPTYAILAALLKPA